MASTTTKIVFLYTPLVVVAPQWSSLIHKKCRVATDLFNQTDPAHAQTLCHADPKICHDRLGRGLLQEDRKELMGRCVKMLPCISLANRPVFASRGEDSHLLLGSACSTSRRVIMAPPGSSRCQEKRGRARGRQMKEESRRRLIQKWLTSLSNSIRLLL